MDIGNESSNPICATQGPCAWVDPFCPSWVQAFHPFGHRTICDGQPPLGISLPEQPTPVASGSCPVVWPTRDLWRSIRPLGSCLLCVAMLRSWPLSVPACFLGDALWLFDELFARLVALGFGAVGGSLFRGRQRIPSSIGQVTLFALRRFAVRRAPFLRGPILERFLRLGVRHYL